MALIAGCAKETDSKIKQVFVSENNLTIHNYSTDNFFSIQNNFNNQLNISLKFDSSIIAISPEITKLNPSEKVRFKISVRWDKITSDSLYSLILVKLNNRTSDSIKLKLQNLKNNILYYAHNFVDASYDKTNNILYYISNAPAYYLFKCNLKLNTLDSFQLRLPPKFLSLSADFSNAAIGSDGGIDYINLNNLSLVNRFRLNHSCLGMILGPRSWIYFFPEDSPYSMNDSIISINGANREYRAKAMPDYILTLNRLTQDGKYIYGSWMGAGSTDNLVCYTITSGVITMVDGGYSQNYQIGHNFWYSANGYFMYCRSGKVYQLAASPGTTMKEAGQLEFQISPRNVVWIDPCPTKHLILTVINYYLLPNFDEEPASEIELNNDQNFLHTGSLAAKNFYKVDATGNLIYYRPITKFAFTNAEGNKAYIISQAAEGSGIMSDWSLQTMEIN
jgi:hypothetical protein